MNRDQWLGWRQASVAVCFAILAGCAHAPEQSSAAAVSEPSAVAVAKVTTEDLSHGLVLTAEFRPFQEIDVMAKVSGYVKTIYVDVGDRVKEGQVLAVLEIPEMVDDLAKSAAAFERSGAEVARARDEVARAESNHQMVHLTYTRLAEVNRKRPNLVAQQEIDDARGRDMVAEAQLASAKSNLAAVTQLVSVASAELRRTKTMNEYMRVTAPFAGVVTRRFANTGSMIQAGTASQTQAMPIVTLSQNNLLRLILPVPESAVPRVHVGQRVQVRVPTLDRTFGGTVARFADKVQTATRTMDTQVDVPNPSSVLIPGMYAEVDLTMDSRAKALAVPVAAIDLAGEGQDPSKANVIVVNEARRIERRMVTIGMQTALFAEVRAGLREGEMVVLANRASLREGQNVQPKEVTMSAIAEGRRSN